MDLLNLGKHLFFNTSQTENGVTLATIAIDFLSATDHRVDYLCREHMALPPTKRGGKFGTWTRIVSFEQLLKSAVEKHKDAELTICYADAFIIDYCNRFKANPSLRVQSNGAEFDRIFKLIRPPYLFIRRSGQKYDGRGKAIPTADPCPLTTLSKAYAELSIENASLFENRDKIVQQCALMAFERDEKVQGEVPQHLW
jgi:hypothetical protein